MRVPTIAFWPGITPAGSTCDEPIIGIDFYPTLLEIAGLEGDAKHNEAVDGLSIVPLLKNPDAQLERDAIFWHYPHYHAGGDGPYSAIRARDWRLVQFHEDDSVRLYNLAKDIGEQHDLAGSKPGLTKKLRDQLVSWCKEIGAQMPTPNPKHDPSKATEVSRRAGR